MPVPLPAVVADKSQMVRLALDAPAVVDRRKEPFVVYQATGERVFAGAVVDDMMKKPATMWLREHRRNRVEVYQAGLMIPTVSWVAASSVTMHYGLDLLPEWTNICAAA